MKNSPVIISIVCVAVFTCTVLRLNQTQLKATSKKVPNAFILPVLDLHCKFYRLNQEYPEPNTPLLNVWYIGKWKRKITIEGKADFDMNVIRIFFSKDSIIPIDPIELADKHPYLMEEFDKRSFKYINKTPIKITIDTTINYSKDAQKRVYAVYLLNINSDTLVIGSNNALSLSFTRWQNKQWESIHQSGWCGDCGNGCYRFYLPPKEIAITFIELDRKKTSWYQLRTDKSYSNRFQ